MLNHQHLTSHKPCPECDIGIFSRNHYFTGKLLVEADFTDEQHYYREKMRHHEQRLHGWGVVCGLKVTQYDVPTCLNRFVYIEPGTAIDCCGHEIVLRQREAFDINQSAEIQDLRRKVAQDPTLKDQEHALQICVSYKECPTEEIPVLYDDCGCNDNRCAPNRILESHDFDVLLDKLEPPADVNNPILHWHATASVYTPHALRVALHEESNVFYVLTETALYRVQADNLTYLASPLPANTQGLDMTISNDGTRLYVVTGSTNTPGAKHVLQVLDSTDGTSIYTTDIDHTDGGASPEDKLTKLAVAPSPDNRLLALVPGHVLVWDTTIDNPPPGSTPQVSDVNLGTFNGSDMVIQPQIKNSTLVAFLVDETNSRGLQIDLTTTPPSPRSPTSLGFHPAKLAIIQSGDAVLGAFADNSGTQPTINLFDRGQLGTVTLDHPIVDMRSSQSGHWLYVLEVDQASGASYVQTVNVVKLQQKQQVTPSPVFQVGNYSKQLVLSASDRRLYIPYLDHLQIQPGDIGKVAILDINEQLCGDLLWSGLDGCPSCETPNCVILATIQHYKLDYDMRSPETLPTDTTSDDQNKISRIDNRTGRRLLPSTQVLAETLSCLLDSGVGGGGKQGPMGPTGPKGDTGPPGPGIDDVNLNIVPCNVPKRGEIQTINNVRTLILDIPSECAEAPPTFTHICAISWPHGGEVLLSEVGEQGLLVAFDQNIQPEDIHEHSVLVQVQEPSTHGHTITNCYCDVNVYKGKLETIRFKTCCRIDQGFALPTADNPAVDGLRFKPEPPLDLGTYRVEIRGDLIRDQSGKAVDANHLPPWLPKRSTGDKVEGGTFYSWFTVTRQLTPVGHHLINLNHATFEELTSLPGIGTTLAERIMAARNEKPFESVDDLLHIHGISANVLENLRHLVFAS
jgi:hypothetical protein